MSIVRLPAVHRRVCRELFAPVPRWRAFIESALEDGIGLMLADNEAEPKAAVLLYGGAVVYAGDPEAPAAGDLVRAFDVQPLVLGWNDRWVRLLAESRNGALGESTRYHLPADGISWPDDSRSRTTPFGSARPITRDDVAGIEKDLGWEHHLHHYRSIDDFVTRGNGYIVTDGDAVASAASSYAVSSNRSECQVTTAEAYRRRGLALAVCAAYLESCLARGLSVPWDAGNKTSVALARSLGYSNVEEYSVYHAFAE